MKKIILLLSLISLFACVDQDAIRAKESAKARHQAETGSRINAASQNTESLFGEIK
jgi:hypothetical protein